jgi:hypothetical protein
MINPMNKNVTIECLGGKFYKTSLYSEGLSFKVCWVTKCWDVGRNVEEPPSFTNRFHLTLINVIFLKIFFKYFISNQKALYNCFL